MLKKNMMLLVMLFHPAVTLTALMQLLQKEFMMSESCQPYASPLFPMFHHT